MSKRHKPDHEMVIMQRIMRDLTGLSVAGRERVLAYWTARAGSLPDVGEQHGEQQLDIEVDAAVEGARA